MSQKSELTASAQRVQDALTAHGVDCQVVELAASTRTAQEAAEAVGCEVGQIVKSLIFRSKHSGRAVLVLASGANRVDEQKLRALLGEQVTKPNADFVRAQTGYAIGGVPPLGHVQPLETFIDEELLQYDEIWAAAGTPHAVFRLRAEDLQRVTDGRVVEIKR